jgi:DNA polymerase III alpha subunit
MKIDKFGMCCVTERDLCRSLYLKPDLDLSRFLLDNPSNYNRAVQSLYVETPILEKYYEATDLTVEEFDHMQQQQWHMPTEYVDLDIAQHVLDLCKDDAELQRAGEELLLYQERDLFDLLRYLKYLVDVLRENSIVWGVGRGSSVSSFVLYLIGVHKINSLHYDLDPREFLK